MSELVVLAGRCFCGAISYRANGNPLLVTDCYCRPCQKISGAPYIPFLEYLTRAVTWQIHKKDDEQPANVEVDSADFNAAVGSLKSDVAIRTFCRVCGTQMTMAYYKDPEMIAIPRGTLDEQSEKAEGVDVSTTQQIFVSQKSKYGSALSDSLPRFDRFSSGFKGVDNE